MAFHLRMVVMLRDQCIVFYFLPHPIEAGDICRSCYDNADVDFTSEKTEIQRSLWA